MFCIRANEFLGVRGSVMGRRLYELLLCLEISKQNANNFATDFEQTTRISRKYKVLMSVNESIDVN